MCGDAAHPASKGPGRCAGAAHELLTSRGIPVTDARVEADPTGDAPAASLEVNRRLAPLVRGALEAGQLPLVLAGSCDASLGIVAALDDQPFGVVWLDAHGDFNTPESSASGFFPGMSLAIVVGHCHREHWTELGGARPIAEEATVLLGVRDLSPAAERSRLEESAVRTVPWSEGRAQGDVLGALDALAGLVPSVYLHVDLDALDPSVAPGIVDDAVPGGLSLEDASGIVRGVAERFDVRAAALTTYVPDRDRDDRTLHAQLRIVELLAGS
jgi:arginase